jgi:type IV pilus assembly protein PilE
MNAARAARQAHQRGVTLVELLVALVIVGILTSVALPMYTRYQERSYATQAMADLGSCAQALERHYTVNFTYGGAADDGGGGAQDTGAPLAATCPAVSPPRGQALYNITITVADATTFTLRATPINGQPAQGVGLMEIDATGLQRWDKNGNGTLGEADEDNWNI